MNKVVNVNLSGNAYLVEEAGFENLHAYLEGARLRLQGNPDLEEIMDDLEQSVADKMNRFLSTRKTVITAAEVEQIVNEMGPVDGADDAEAAADRKGAANEEPDLGDERDTGVRKLYKLTSNDEKMLTGVCAGLAAYFGIDVTIVRIIFIALAFASAGVVILFYLLLALIVPPADTPQQHAAAYGIPFDAREVIERAKSKFNDLRDAKEWKAQQRYWNRHARNAGFDGVNSVLGLVVVLFGILIGLLLLRGIFFAIGFPMYSGMHVPFAPWLAILLMVIIGVYLIGWVFGERNNNRSGLGSVLIKTAQVLSILLIIYVALRILF